MNASTSVVLVATSVNAPTDHVVLFPQLSTIGRLITVRDNDGQASLTNPIVMSTVAGVTFTTGNEIRINQPFGFVTVTTQTPTTYSILNTFAFPAEQSAANIQTLNAQTINVSTIQLLDVSTSLPVSLYSSTNKLIYNNDYVGDITNEELQSTVIALGTIGYLSTIPDYFPIPPVWVAVGISSNNAPTPNAIGNPVGTLQYSKDSITWKNAANGGFTQYGTATAFDGKGMFIAVGANRTVEGSNLGYIKWSYNGSNWQDSLSPYLSTTQERTGVLYANGFYHAIGYSPRGGPNTILWSLDGKSFNPSQGNPFSSPSGLLGYANGIAYGAGVWVCAGAQDALSAQNSLLWSTDGINWNPAATSSWTGDEVYDVSYDGTQFIALTKNGLNPNSTNIARSTNGSNWSSTGLTGGNFNNLARYVAGNGQQWIVTTNDTNKSLVYSLNGGITWKTDANIATCNVNMYKPYYDGSKWLIGVQTGASQSIYYSTDAQTWTTATIQSQFINGGYARGFSSSDGLSNVNLLLTSTMTGLANNFVTSTLNANTISSSIINADAIYSGVAYVSTVFIGTTIVSTTYEAINNISTQNVDFISAGTLEAYNTRIQNLQVDNLSTSYGFFSTLEASYISTETFNASEGFMSSFFVEYISSQRVFIDDLKVINLDAGYVSFTGGSLTNLNVENLSTTYEKVSTLQSSYISSGIFYGGVATIEDLSIGTLSTSFGTMSSLNVDNLSTKTTSAVYLITSTLSTSFVYSDKLGIGSIPTNESVTINGQTRISYNTIIPDPALVIENTPNKFNFYPKLQAGDFNNIVGANDSALIFEAGQNNGNLVIANWNTNTYGMKFTSTGFIGINVASPQYELDVNGIINARSSLYVGSPFVSTNTIRFAGTPGDTGYTTSVIGERIYGDSELSELLLFKGNDGLTPAGPDRVRVLARGGFQVDVAGTGSSGRWPLGGDPPAPSFANCITVSPTNGNVGIGNAFPATTLVVNVPNTSSITGIVANSWDVNTIIGANSVANNGSIQVTRLGSFSTITTTPYTLHIQPIGGETVIGSNNNSFTTTVNGPLNVNESITANNAAIGSNAAFVNIASFSHSSYKDTTNVALYQDSTGNTYLNSKLGQTVTFRTGNNEMGYFDSATSNLHINGSLYYNSLINNNYPLSVSCNVISGLSGSAGTWTKVVTIDISSLSKFKLLKLINLEANLNQGGGAGATEQFISFNFVNTAYTNTSNAACIYPGLISGYPVGDGGYTTSGRPFSESVFENMGNTMYVWYYGSGGNPLMGYINFTISGVL